MILEKREETRNFTRQRIVPIIFEQSEKTHFSIALKITPQCGVDVHRLGGSHEKSRIPWALAQGRCHFVSGKPVYSRERGKKAGTIYQRRFRRRM